MRTGIHSKPAHIAARTPHAPLGRPRHAGHGIGAVSTMMIRRSPEHRMGKWKRLYFALAVLSALFLFESLHPFF